MALNREDRTQTASQFLSALHWAEKGARRVLGVSIIIILLAIANVFLIDSVDDDIPLSTLPAAEQQIVLDSIAEAETALHFEDYNGALVYLDRAYRLHPNNDDVENRSHQILGAFEQQLNNNKTNAGSG